jgi:hypothetical protein
LVTLQPNRVTAEEAKEILQRNTAERSRKVTDRFIGSQTERANRYIEWASRVIQSGKRESLTSDMFMIEGDGAGCKGADILCTKVE